MDEVCQLRLGADKKKVAANALLLESDSKTKKTISAERSFSKSANYRLKTNVTKYKTTCQTLAANQLNELSNLNDVHSAGLAKHAETMAEAFNKRLAELKVCFDRREHENLGFKADLQVSFDKRIAEQVYFDIKKKETLLAIETDRDKQVSELERRESNLVSRKSALEATVESLAEEDKN